MTPAALPLVLIPSPLWAPLLSTLAAAGIAVRETGAEDKAVDA